MRPPIEGMRTGLTFIPEATEREADGALTMRTGRSPSYIVSSFFFSEAMYAGPTCSFGSVSA